MCGLPEFGRIDPVKFILVGFPKFNKVGYGSGLEKVRSSENRLLQVKPVTVF